MANLTINGETRQVDLPDEVPLLWALRDSVGLTGTKYGCGIQQCGACTVLIGKRPVRSCGITVGEVLGSKGIKEVIHEQLAPSLPYQRITRQLTTPELSDSLRWKFKYQLHTDANGYKGTELQDDINSDPKALARFETIRAHGAVKMGLIQNIEEAANRQHTPKVAFVAKPSDYVSSSSKSIGARDVDVLVRALSMGKLHHAMMGTAAVAIASAAAIEGTLVNLAAGGGKRTAVTFGHPSGTLRVGAEASLVDGRWVIDQAVMSRSARVLMEGFVRVPGDSF